MSGPWEDFKKAEPEAGPWDDFAPKNAAPSTGDAFANGPLKIGAAAFPDALRETLRGVDWGTRNLAGAGAAVSNMLEGGKQLVKGSELYNLIMNQRMAKAGDGAGTNPQIQANKIIEQEAPIGAIMGSIATTLPMMAVGNAPAAVGAVGSIYGALRPAESEGQRVANTAIAGGLGAGGQVLANKAQSYLANKLQQLMAQKAKNAVLDQTLQESVAAGYKVPPSLMPDSGVGSRILEGLSGKFKTNQAAGIKNQAVTDALARKAVGLADDAPLTSEAMQQIRTKAFKSGYEPVEQVGAVTTDSAFAGALDKLVANRKMASNSFPNAVKDEITPFIESMKVGKFDAGEAIKMTQILRDEASAAYRAGDNAMGQAKKGAAKAIEDQIERGLLSKGKDGVALLKGFRDARQAMAKAHTVEDAIREGGGRVDAMKLAARFQAGKPLTGELATIGKFANNFGREGVAGIPKSGNASPFTALDFMQTGLSAPLGMIAGGPIGIAASLGIPAARVGARYGLLSNVMQKGMARPEYALGVPARTLGSVVKNAPVAGTVGGLYALGQ